MAFTPDPENLCVSGNGNVLTGGGENAPYGKSFAFDGKGGSTGLAESADFWPNGKIGWKFLQPTIVNKFAIYNEGTKVIIQCPFISPWYFFGTNDETLATNNLVLLQSYNTIPTTATAGTKLFYEIENSTPYLCYGIYMNSTGDIFLGELEMFYDVKNLFLFYKNNEINKWNGTTLEPITGITYPPLIDNFTTHGVDKLPTEIKNHIPVKILVSTPNNQLPIKINAIPNNVILKSNVILLNDVSNIDSITVTSTSTGSSNIKFMLITDNDSVGYVYENDNFISYDINEDNFINHGMSNSTINSLPSDKLTSLCLQNKSFKIAIFILLNDISDTNEIDNFSYQIDLKGTWQGGSILNNVYTYTYLDNETLKVTINEVGTYKLNY